MMGGAIGVRSAPGRGCEFHFTLSFGMVETVAPADELSPRYSDLRVLSVDDSATAREILADLLAGLGCQHTEVESSEVALAELDRARTIVPYDLALVDWKMPGTDGFELAQRVRLRAAGLASPRLILVTAYGDEALAQRALDDGFDGYLAKPVTATALASVIDKAMGFEAAPAESVPPHGRADADFVGILKGRRVLLVEDNELNRIVAYDLLHGVAGALVTEAHDGGHAVDVALTEPFDIVLMDVQMPVMDGYAATRRLRTEPRQVGLPIVGMTAHAMARDHALCLAAGMDDVVVKPFEPQELFRVVAKCLARPHTSNSASSDHADPIDSAVWMGVGLRRCMGQQDLYLRLVQRFLQSRRGDPQKLRDALAEGDIQKLAFMAHDLVSIAGSLGAGALAGAATGLNDALCREDLAHLPALVEALAGKHERVMAALIDYAACRTDGA